MGRKRWEERITVLRVGDSGETSKSKISTKSRAPKHALPTVRAEVRKRALESSRRIVVIANVSNMRLHVSFTCLTTTKTHK